jgi:hypothetical protein
VLGATAGVGRKSVVEAPLSQRKLVQPIARHGANRIWRQDLGKFVEVLPPAN